MIVRKIRDWTLDTVEDLVYMHRLSLALVGVAIVVAALILGILAAVGVIPFEAFVMLTITGVLGFVFIGMPVQAVNDIYRR